MVIPVETEQIQVEDGINILPSVEDTTIITDSTDQATEHTRIIPDDRTSHYGNKLAELRDDDSILFTFLNVNGLPQHTTKHKNRSIRNFINYYNIDLFGISEVNLNWSLLPTKDQLQERTLGWWEDSRVSMAYNTEDEATQAYQPGGCLQITRNKMVHCWVEHGKDPSGLGRWTWSKYIGKNNTCLRVVTAYRTSIPSTDPGSNTAHRQQQRFLHQHKDNRTPRQAFMEDIEAEITQWNANNENLVLMVDLNEDVTTDSVISFFSDLGLKEAVTDRHVHNCGVQPTYQRGRSPIDGVYISQHLEIQAGGYLPFGDAPSDHRAVWITLDFESILGYDTYRPIRPQARRLKLNNPKVVKNFQQSYFEYIRATNLDKMAFDLMEQLMYQPMTRRMQQRYEYLYRKRLEGLRKADRGCRKLKMGEVAWSRTLQEAMDTIQLWKVVLSRKRGTRVSTRFISRLERRVDIVNSLHNSQTQVRIKLKEAYTRYYELKKDADKLREDWLQDLAAIQAKEQGGDQASRYKSLLQRERQRHASRRLRRVTQKNISGGLTKVVATSADGSTIEVSDKEGIEQACHEENRKKFSQTNSTPLMSGQLADEIGYTGTSAACQRVLEGTYDPPEGTDEYTTDLLLHLRKPPNISNPPSAYLTTQEFQEGWKKMKETTSAGISGITFAHMKAAAQHDHLAAFEATMAHIPYSTGYSPQDWKKSVSVMIEKKGKGIQVEDLRTIQLLQAESNFNNKKVGRDTMQTAEANKLIPREQYGSRKQKQAILHAVNKRLLYDITHYQRRPAALCSNDAKSCYDRIIHSVASMALQRLGMPEQPVTCMLVSIQDFEHHVRTAFGDSKSVLVNEAGIPFQGLCQGNGASPTVWVAVSAPLLDMMRDADHGIYLQSPLSQEDDHFVGFAFVDDTDIVEGYLKTADFTIYDIMTSMQEAVNRWEGGLKATGGAIRPDKSFIYPIDFKFDQRGVCSHKLPEEINSEITVRDHNDTRYPLRQVPAHVGEETLGVYLAPDGSCKEATAVLRKKADRWRNNIQVGKLPPHEAWQCVSSTILKTLMYPLPALTMTESECNHVFAPVRQAGLNHSGINRNFPSDLVFGSTDELGLGLDHLFTIQGASKLTIFQEYINSNEITGNLLRAALEWATIHIGLPGNLFDHDYDTYGHLLPRSFIRTLWEFTSTHNIKVPRVHPELEHHRERDRYLMHDFVLSNTVSKKDLQKLNRCRLYLKVTTLSDITSGDGETICKQYWDGIRDDQRSPLHDWPEQGDPGDRDWTLWRKALKNSFDQTRRKLHTPLGRWVDTHRDKWKWFYHPLSRRLYTKRPGTNRWKMYERYHRTVTVRKGTKFRYSMDAMSLPVNSQRATIIQDHNHVSLQGWAPEGIPYIPNPAAQDELAQSWMVHSIYNEHHTHLIAAHLQAGGTLHAVSDGSFHPHYKRGTAGWVISIPETGHYVTATNSTPGQPDHHCSHRSELSGLIGVVRHLNVICKRYNITSGSIEVGCDGEEAYKVATRYNYQPTTRISHFDLTSKLHYLINSSPLHWRFRHVKGHQDDSATPDKLDNWALMNIHADKLAKHQLWEDIVNSANYFDCPHINNTLPIASIQSDQELHTIVSKGQHNLLQYIASQRTTQYWLSRDRPINHPMIDKNVLGHAARNIPTWDKRWISKWSSGHCGVGVKLLQWKEQKHSKCPRCSTDHETVDHVICCTHVDATSIWTTGIESLRTWMRKHHCLYDLDTAVCTRLLQWRSGVPLIPLRGVSNEVVELITDMDQLGWRNLLFGLVPRSWTTAQQIHLASLNKKTLGENWMSQFVRQLWKLQKDLWLDRNKHLHNNGKSIHEYEMEQVNKEITREFAVGRAGLSADFSGTFSGQAKRILDKDDISKLQWLASVWHARDMRRTELGLGPWPRDVTAANFISKFHQRRKRNRRVYAEESVSHQFVSG